jgi:ABC-type molybdate transport system substrate-binding protein
MVTIAAPNIDKLIAEGQLAAGDRADFAKSGVVIAVRSGLPKSNVFAADAVIRAVLAVRSVAYPSGLSGFYVADMFKKMGIADQIKGKVTQPAFTDLTAGGGCLPVELLTAYREPDGSAVDDQGKFFVTAEKGDKFLHRRGRLFVL